VLPKEKVRSLLREERLLFVEENLEKRRMVLDLLRGSNFLLKKRRDYFQ